MHIDQCECALEVAVEVLHLLKNVVLQLLVLAGIVETGVEVKQVGGWHISFLKDPSLLQAFEVLGYDHLHALVEIGVVS